MRMMAIQRITENTKATKEIPIQNCTHKGGPAAEGRPHSGSNVIFHGISNGIAHAQLDISCICLFDHSVFAWVVIYNQPTFCSWGGVRYIWFAWWILCALIAAHGSWGCFSRRGGNADFLGCPGCLALDDVFKSLFPSAFDGSLVIPAAKLCAMASSASLFASGKSASGGPLIVSCLQCHPFLCRQETLMPVRALIMFLWPSPSETIVAAAMSSGLKTLSMLTVTNSQPVLSCTSAAIAAVHAPASLVNASVMESQQHLIVVVMSTVRREKNVYIYIYIYINNHLDSTIWIQLVGLNPLDSTFWTQPVGFNQFWYNLLDSTRWIQTVGTPLLWTYN